MPRCRSRKVWPRSTLRWRLSGSSADAGVAYRARYQRAGVGAGLSRQCAGRIVTAWRQGGLDVVLSRYILDEMVRVLPRLSKVQMTHAEIRDLADSFMFLADIVEPGRRAGCESARSRRPARASHVAGREGRLSGYRRQGLAGTGRPIPRCYSRGVLGETWGLNRRSMKIHG